MLSTYRTRAPSTDEYQSYYDRYVSLVPEGNIVDIAAEQLEYATRLFLSLSEEDAIRCHPPYTQRRSGFFRRQAVAYCKASVVRRLRALRWGICCWDIFGPRTVTGHFTRCPDVVIKDCIG